LAKGAPPAAPALAGCDGPCGVVTVVGATAWEADAWGLHAVGDVRRVWRRLD
jgi:hypothetical protein